MLWQQIKGKTTFYTNENDFLQSWNNNYAQFNLFNSDIFSFFLCFITDDLICPLKL